MCHTNLCVCFILFIVSSLIHRNMPEQNRRVLDPRVESHKA